MAIEKSKQTTPNASEKQQLAQARKRKSQAVQPPVQQQTTPTTAAAQSVQSLQSTDQSFAAFQQALQQKLGQMHASTIDTARQVAEVEQALPMVFEQAYAQRKAELGGGGNGPASFPSIDNTPRPAFDLAGSLQLPHDSATDRPLLEGTGATPAAICQEVD